MIADKFIFAILSNDAGVSAIVDDRIFPIAIPQDTEYPAIAYSAVYTPANNTKDTPATHDNCTFTLRSWAATYDAAAALDKAIRQAIDSVAGAWVDDSGEGVTAGTVTVDVCEWQSSTDGIEEGKSDNTDVYFFREAVYFLREKL